MDFFWVGPKCHRNGLYEMQKEMTGAHKGKGEGETEEDVTTSPGMPGATRSWKRQGRILPESPQREASPANNLISDFWPPDL